MAGVGRRACGSDESGAKPEGLKTSGVRTWMVNEHGTKRRTICLLDISPSKEVRRRGLGPSSSLDSDPSMSRCRDVDVFRTWWKMRPHRFKGITGHMIWYGSLAGQNKTHWSTRAALHIVICKLLRRKSHPQVNTAEEFNTASKCIG